MHAPIRDELDAAIAQVLDANSYILGQHVERFEENFAAYCEARCAVGVDNGTSALELILRALGIGEGDEVIAPTNSFIATASAIAFAGAKPVLVDCDAESYGIDVAQVEAAITGRTAAIMPVHLYGHPAELDELARIAERHGLALIEDACQAHGARYGGRRVGAIGVAGGFSFYPGKNLGAAGDGGMVVTNDAELAEKVRMLRNYGQKEKYQHLFLAYNRRLDALQAAFLDVKLRYLDQWNARRREAAQWYDGALRHSGLALPQAMENVEHVYHLYVVRTQDRAGLQARLDQANVQWGIHYPVPIHLQPAYEWLGLRRGSFPVAESQAPELLSLPMHPCLSRDDIRRVANALCGCG
jgi:dTDP-4-amino-4,6-dideoxygalactose transaminase